VLQAKHHPDLIMCRKQPGIAIGRLCEKCDGKCVVCDSYVRPATLVRICDECNYGSYAGRCVICGGIGISDAYYCKECTQQEKDVRPPPLLHLATNLASVCTACLLSRWRTSLYPLTTSLPCAERWLPKDHQSGLSKDGSILRAQKVWLQEVASRCGSGWTFDSGARLR